MFEAFQIGQQQTFRTMLNIMVRDDISIQEAIKYLETLEPDLPESTAERVLCQECKRGLMVTHKREGLLLKTCNACYRSVMIEEI